MRKLVVTSFMTLDGVIQAPGGPDEDRDGGFDQGGWSVGYWDEMFALERRVDVRRLIGERAEKLAYLNCAMDRASFDRLLTQTDGPYRFADRITGGPVELDKTDYDDLCRIHLFDFLEQVPRAQQWDYRRASYRQMAERLGGVVLESYDQVFAAASAGVG